MHNNLFSFSVEYPTYGRVYERRPKQYVNRKIFDDPKLGAQVEVSNAYKKLHDAFDANYFMIQFSLEVVI